MLTRSKVIEGVVKSTPMGYLRSKKLGPNRVKDGFYAALFA